MNYEEARALHVREQMLSFDRCESMDAQIFVLKRKNAGLPPVSARERAQAHLTTLLLLEKIDAKP